MLARLLLALLLVAFAIPSAAPAACHDDAPGTLAMATPAHAPDRQATAAHDCIGCIPPSDWLSPRLAQPALVVALPTATVPPARLASLAPSPSTPPPRHG